MSKSIQVEVNEHQITRQNSIDAQVIALAIISDFRMSQHALNWSSDKAKPYDAMGALTKYQKIVGRTFSSQDISIGLYLANQEIEKQYSYGRGVEVIEN
mgnify:CR=1 FL=1